MWPEAPIRAGISRTERWAWVGCGMATALAWLATWALARSMNCDMTMPGGLSMMWMPMGRQTELGAALIFLVMWECMMVAMMLLSALPVFMIARQAARHQNKPGSLAALVGTGYFVSWLLFGAAVYATGRSFALLVENSGRAAEAIPLLTGAAILAAGFYQLTPLKNVCLRHCRGALFFVAQHWHPSAWGAFRTGFHHGNYCVACCWALMVIQCVLGMMSFPLMLAVAAVIAAEKLSPGGEWIARVVGIASIIAGGAMIYSSLVIGR